MGRVGELVASAQHGLLNTLFLVELAVQNSETEYISVESYGLVEIRHGIANVVNADKKIGIIHACSLSYTTISKLVRFCLRTSGSDTRGALARAALTDGA